MDGNLDDVIDFARWRRRHDDFLWHGHVMNVRDGLVVVPRQELLQATATSPGPVPLFICPLHASSTTP